MGDLGFSCGTLGLQQQQQQQGCKGFPGGSEVRVCLQCRRPGFDPWVGKIPWRRKWQNAKAQWLKKKKKKYLPANAEDTGDTGSIPGWVMNSEGRHGNPLQYYCLENPMVGGAWWATVHRAAKSRTRLSDFTHSFTQGCKEIKAVSPKGNQP